MKASTRWTIVIAILVLIAILLWFWMHREAPRPPVAGEVVTKPEPQPVSKPEPKPEPKPVASEPLTASLLFDFDRSSIRPGEATKLDDIAAKLVDRPGEGLEIAGYADRIGSKKYNLALSKRRAEAVRDYLVGKGVKAGAFGLGEMGEAEAATGDTCKALGPANRRNRKLIDCLQPDRRAELRTAPKP